MLPEVRMARVLDAISSHRAGRLSCVEAGQLPTPILGRDFPRWGAPGDCQASVATMTSKGFAPLSLAVSIVVRTSASACAAHMAR